MFRVLFFVFCSVFGVTTVKLDPSDASPFNDGVFQGWCTSLCWWANRVGYNKDLTQQAADLFFSDSGLNLDIGRYNVGGGDNPSHNHITRSDSNIPGYATGFGSNGAINYDWTRDANQRAVAKAAQAAHPNLIFEGFSNSPPYFMTVSGCSTGNSDSAKDNLKAENRTAFATYIADVTKHFRDSFGITFQSYSPMNEPDTTYWFANNPKQEGCHYDHGNSESLMIVELRKALDAAGLNSVLVAGMDETSVDQTLTNLDSLSSAAKTALGRIDTHLYGGTKRAEVRAKAISMGKNLWMSEVDKNGVNGSSPGNMGAGLNLAWIVLADLNKLKPSAWCTWNLIDINKDSNFAAPNGSKTEANNKLDQSAGLWGVGLADHDAKKILLTQKYYVFGQFTRYIRAGDTLISNSDIDHVAAAYNKKTGTIKIVAVNFGGSTASYTFDLSALDVRGTAATAYRTSGAFDGGEHWKNVGKATVTNKSFSYDLPANSVTSFVIE